MRSKRSIEKVMEEVRTIGGAALEQLHCVFERVEIQPHQYALNTASFLLLAVDQSFHVVQRVVAVRLTCKRPLVALVVVCSGAHIRRRRYRMRLVQICSKQKQKRSGAEAEQK